MLSIKRREFVNLIGSAAPADAMRKVANNSITRNRGFDVRSLGKSKSQRDSRVAQGELAEVT